MVYIAFKSSESKRFVRRLNKVEKKYIQEQQPINSTVTAGRWVLSTEWTRTRPGTGLVYKWTNDGAPALLSWMVDVVLHNARVLYRINKDEGDECSFT